MLYLMLVMVFSSLSKKWWFFLVLGWGKPLHMNACMHWINYYFLYFPAVPLLPVIIGASVRHDGYGVTDKNGQLQL